MSSQPAPSTPRPARQREVGIVALVAAALLAAFVLVFMPPLGRSGPGIGLDYAYFMPPFMSGYYWLLESGPFAIPWFTPSECGGVPLLPNPQAMYYSLAQVLFFLVEPVLAFRLFYMISALAGFLGMAGLIRRGFGASLGAALTGATVFMLNGFLIERMLVGHMAYESMVLLPFWAWFLLARPPGGWGPGRLGRVAVAGSVPALMILGGSAGSMVPFGLAMVGLGLLHGLLRGFSREFWLDLVSSSAFGLGLTAFKLVPAAAFLAHFPREMYEVAGAPSLGQAFALVGGGLFLGGLGPPAVASLRGYAFKLEPYELDYSVTLVPLLLCLAALLIGARRRAVPAASWLPGGALAGILILPVVLNFGWDPWRAVLGQVPYVRNTSLLLRWIVLDIPILAVLAAVALDALPLVGWRRGGLAALAILGVLAQQAWSFHDRTLFPRYHPENMSAAHAQAHATGRAQPISVIARMVNERGETIAPLFRDDLMARGASQLLCYEPLFGYDLEALDTDCLALAPVLAEYQGALNLRNPACFLYPEENGCRPDGRFRLDQLDEAAAFASYRAFSFAAPLRHHLAMALSALCALLLVGTAAWTGLVRGSALFRRE